MLNRFYILTLSMLATHQIDAAYWREWEMFSVPGGIEMFDLINLFLVVILLFGFQNVIERRPRGFFYSVGLGILGMVTLMVHGCFYLLGQGRFNLPVSILVILGCGTLGLAQVVVSIRERGSFRRPG